MEKIRQNWWILLLEGMLFIFLGIMAIMLPQVSTLSIELIIGSLILIGGIMQLFRAVKFWRQELFWPSLMTGLLGSGIGWYMLANPLQGMITLSILLLIFLALEGILKAMAGIAIKPNKGWGWFLASGLLSLIIVAVALSNWPIIATWLLGLLLGVNMLFFGSSMIFTAFTFRSIIKEFA